MKNQSSSDNIIFGILLIAAAVIYSLLSYLTPYQMDDLVFIDMYHRYNNDSNDFSLRALTAFLHELRTFDNSRLANVCSPLSTLISPWKQIFPFLTGPLIALTIWFAVRFSGPWQNARWKVGALAWFLIVLFLPWRNGLFIPDYQLNYIYSAAITLAFIWATIPGRRHLRNPLAMAAVVLLAVIAGCWHEGFSATTCCALAVFGISKRLRLPWQWWTVCIIYGLATLWITFSPGVMMRASVETAREIPINYVKLLADQSAFVLLCASIIIFLLFRSTRRFLREALNNDIFLPLCTIALAGTILSMIVTHTPRTSFWPALASVIALLCIWRPVIQRFLSRRFLSGFAAILCVSLCLAQGIYSCVWQYRFDQENKQIWNLIEATDSNTIYYDIIMPESVSPLTLYFPNRILWITGFHFKSLSTAIRRPGTVVVPTDLRDPLARYDSLPRQEGYPTLYRTGNALWMRDIPDLDRISPTVFDVTFADGSRDPHRDAFVSRFVTEKGDTLCYVKIHKTDAANVRSAKPIIIPRFLPGEHE